MLPGREVSGRRWERGGELEWECMHLLDGKLGHGLLSYSKVSVRHPTMYLSKGFDLGGGGNLPTSMASCCISSVCVLECQLQATQISGSVELTMSALLIWASSCFSRAPGEVAPVSTMVAVRLDVCSILREKWSVSRQLRSRGKEKGQAQPRQPDVVQVADSGAQRADAVSSNGLRT